MKKWEWLHHMTPTSRSFPRTIVANQFSGQNLPELQTLQFLVGMCHTIQDKGVRDGHVKEKAGDVPVEFSALHSDMVVATMLVSRVDSTHILVVINTSDWTGIGNLCPVLLSTQHLSSRGRVKTCIIAASQSFCRARLLHTSYLLGE